MNVLPKDVFFYFPINFDAKITLFCGTTKQSQGKISFFPHFYPFLTAKQHYLLCKYG